MKKVTETATICGHAKVYAEKMCYSCFQAWRRELGKLLRAKRIAQCPGQLIWDGMARSHDGCCVHPEPWPKGTMPEGTYQQWRSNWLQNR